MVVALDFTRAFNWGILVVSGAGALVPELVTREAPLLASSESALVLRVRHAHDRDDDAVDDEGYLLPFEVRVEASLGEADERGSVEQVLIIASGEILIGDADSEERLTVPPGSYRVAAVLDDPEFAAHVRLRIQRLAS